jgi:hypothetical protein
MLTHHVLLTKISQAEKVGQIQHPHHAIKSVSKGDHVFLSLMPASITFSLSRTELPQKL